MDFKEEIIKLLKKETKLPKDYLNNVVVTPPDRKLGDYAFPCFKLGKNPKEEAQNLKEKLELPNFLQNVQVVGPYLNFFLNHAVLAQETLSAIYKEAKHYGQLKQKGEKILIEYCGPNTNKPLHLGHIRNMALGNSMVRILSFMGNKVHPVNIINDRGIHICKSMLAYQNWGKNKEPNKKSDHFVGDYYVLFAQKAAKNEELNNEAQKLLVKWEENDPETRKVWKKMNDWVIKGHNETYKRFGVSFDKEYFESKYYENGKEIALEGLDKKIFKKNKDGAIIAELEKYKLSDKVILRADQTSIYITQDMYLAGLRYRDYKFNKLIYVVASEQKLHFQQLFKILELLKRPYASGLFHLSYGMVHLPSGRMKSREGTVVDADDIMDEVSLLAQKEIKKRHPNLSEEKTQERADAIGLAAIKFFMLHTDPVRDMTFDSKASLSFEGETGPYLQYTHARACSILRKAKDEHQLTPSNHVNFEALSLEEEKAVLNLLSTFPDVLEKVVKDYKPSYLSNYLITLAQSFNEFYHKCPVLSEQMHSTKARLLLVDCVRQVLDNGLGLLGIIAPEEM
jgi:arginyl-tRNA synthetase